jgi:hypothetical protein
MMIDNRYLDLHDLGFFEEQLRSESHINNLLCVHDVFFIANLKICFILYQRFENYKNTSLRFEIWMLK